MIALFVNNQEPARSLVFTYILLALCCAAGCRTGKYWSPLGKHMANHSRALDASTNASTIEAAPESTASKIDTMPSEQVPSGEALLAVTFQRPESTPTKSVYASAMQDDSEADFRRATATSSASNAKPSAASYPVLNPTTPNSMADATHEASSMDRGSPIPPATASKNASEQNSANLFVADNSRTDSPQESAARIDLTIGNVRPNRGPVKVAVFTSAQNFPNKESAVQTLKFDGATSDIKTQLAISEECAIAAFQDIDGNGELTTNRLGIPMEPCGFSNNAVIKRGPPSFAAAAIKPAVTEQPTLVRINLP